MTSLAALNSFKHRLVLIQLVHLSPGKGEPMKNHAGSCLFQMPRVALFSSFPHFYFCNYFSSLLFPPSSPINGEKTQERTQAAKSSLTYLTFLRKINSKFAHTGCAAWFCQNGGIIREEKRWLKGTGCLPPQWNLHRVTECWHK